MVDRRCPYQSDLSKDDLTKHYQNEWNRWEMNELKWIEVNRGEMSDLMDLTWNNPMRKSLWSVEGVPMEVTWVNPMRMSLSKWMDSMRNEWIEWIEWNEVKWVIWWNWLGTTLWESPYGWERVSLSKWLEWKCKWMSLSIWMDSMRNEWSEVNRGE